jgi:hypothetical protein
MPAAIRRIHSKYLGERTFPKEITEFEIREFFTLSAEDLRAIRIDSNKKSRLALALQVGFLRMTGAALDTYDYIPRAVLECVAKQLHVPAPMIPGACESSVMPLITTRPALIFEATRRANSTQPRNAVGPTPFVPLIVESIRVSRQNRSNFIFGQCA